jgi:hypothetical protein
MWNTEKIENYTMTNKLNTALCLFGQMRTYERCFPMLEENILEVLDPDVFIHTWRKPGGTWKKDYDKIPDGLVTDKKLETIYGAEDAVIEEFDERYYEQLDGVKMPNKVQELPNLQKGMMPMFYKMRQCTKLKRENEKRKGFNYDLTILVRPDLAIREPVSEKIISNPNVIWTRGTGYYYVDDQFLISTSENIDYLTSIWDRLNEYWETELHSRYGDLGVPKRSSGPDFNPSGITTHHHIGVPERLLHYHMKQSPIDVVSHDIKVKRVRHDDKIESDWDLVYTRGLRSLKNEGVRTTLCKGARKLIHTFCDK